MNLAFDKRYDIRLARLADVGMIMRYIDEVWRKGHIMGADRELFLYEYANGDDVNILMAIDKDSGELEAIFGFLNSSDPGNPANTGKRDIWGSMWKVNDAKPNMPLLGIELARRVVPMTGCRMHIGNGANAQTTIPLRRLYFREKTVRMRQYYYLNPNIDFDNFKIAVVNQWPAVANTGAKACAEAGACTGAKSFLVPLPTMDALRRLYCIELEQPGAIPYKDSWYIEKRYYRHPYYTYSVYGVHDGMGVMGALLIVRVAEANGGRALRIVDYIGRHRLFAGLRSEFERLLVEFDCEYADFFVYGFDETAIFSAGFHVREDNDINVIPNYFEPFLQQNVDIWAHYQLDGTLFFKADGDQDRPNIYRKKGLG